MAWPTIAGSFGRSFLTKQFWSGPPCRTTAGPKARTRFAHPPCHHAHRHRSLRAHHGHTTGAANPVTSVPAACRRRRRPPRDNPAGNARALVRPPGNAHLGARLRAHHVLRQCPGPAARHAARRLPARCGDRARRLRHHLSRLRQPARQDRRDQGVPADRVRRAPGRRPGRAARRAPRRRLRLGPRALSRRGARAGALPPSAHRAGAALTSRPTARPTPSWSSRTAATWPSCCASPAAACRPTRCRRLADGLLRGLGAVHAQGFLHRDIKPSNIIIRRDGVPILIDFGAARQAMGGRTRTPDRRADAAICADRAICPRRQAGAVERHLFRRRRALSRDRGTDAARRGARVGKDPYRPLADTQGDRFEPAFLAAIDRAMAFAPDDRPQSVEEWSALFGISLPKVQDAPTQRLAYAAGVAPPRLGGASREGTEPSAARRRRSRNRGGGRRARWVLGDRRRDGRADPVALPAGDPHVSLAGTSQVDSAPLACRDAAQLNAGRLLLASSDASRAADTAPETSAARRRWSTRPQRAAADGARRCSSAPTRQRGPRGHGGRSAHRGGAGGPAGSRARRAAVVRSGRELRRPGRRRQAPGSRRRRARQRRTPGRRIGRTIS